VGLPEIDNRTEFVAEPHPLIGKQGELLVVLVKASFELLHPADTELVLAPKERERPLRAADIPWGEPDVSSIAYPSDHCVYKPGTDVIVLATAHPPAGPQVTSYDVFVQAGPLRKALKVYGLRVWEADGAGVSPPRAAGSVEMRYENAWGGSDGDDPEHFVEEPRNPIGKGVAANPAKLTHQIAPCIEDPDNPIASARTRPPPAGIGAVGRHWEPRRSYIGTYDKAWQELRAPPPPRGQDDRFQQGASPGLVAFPPFAGGERVGLLNLMEGGGARTFSLPRVGVRVSFVVPNRDPVIVRPHLDTVLIDALFVGPDKPLAAELVWRASVPLPRRPEQARVMVEELTL